MPKTCEACGTTKNIVGSLGGVLLCRAHMADISAEVEQLRAEGKSVNVMGIARRMFREQYSTGNYLLRDVPAELWQSAKQKALGENKDMREVILELLQKYVE